MSGASVSIDLRLENPSAGIWSVFGNGSFLCHVSMRRPGCGYGLSRPGYERYDLESRRLAEEAVWDSMEQAVEDVRKWEAELLEAAALPAVRQRLAHWRKRWAPTLPDAAEKDAAHRALAASALMGCPSCRMLNTASRLFWGGGDWVCAECLVVARGAADDVARGDVDLESVARAEAASRGSLADWLERRR